MPACQIRIRIVLIDCITYCDNVRFLLLQEHLTAQILGSVLFVLLLQEHLTAQILGSVLFALGCHLFQVRIEAAHVGLHQLELAFVEISLIHQSM